MLHSLTPVIRCAGALGAATTMVKSGRKYFLDWLRVLAFGLLILFHIGMLYVSWPYNLKSPRIFPDLEWAMVALTPWRLSLLFFVSGVASRFLSIKLGTAGFAKDRVRRLLPVLLVGMLVINPTQTYVALWDAGRMDVGYFEFWIGSYLVSDLSYGLVMPRWDHLWFLLYLIFYMALFAVGLFVFGKYPYWDEKWHAQTSLFLFGPALWLAFTNMAVSELRPVTHALYDDWAAHLRWGGMFLFGVVCARHSAFWDQLVVRRKLIGVIAVFLLLFQWLVRHLVIDGAIHQAVYSAISGVYAWFAIMAVSGYAGRWLNAPSSLLSYLNTAVLPVYVLHQPAMLVAAFFVFPLSMPLALESALMVVAALILPLITYDLVIKRIGALRFLFGLKPLPPKSAL